jgi:hypothetical protein
LKNSQLDVHPLIDTIPHGVDNHRNRRLWNCFEGDEAVEGTERDRNDLRILRCTPHKNGTEEVIGLWPIYREKATALENVWDMGLGNPPDARFVVACSGDALRMANDFSAALR